MRSVPILAVLLLAAATPALAQSSCVEPSAPAPVDRASVTPDQLRAAMAQAHDFIAQSSVYQQCLLKEVEAAKTQATTSGQPFEPMIETSALYKIETSKKAQQKVGAAANDALTAYKSPR